MARDGSNRRRRPSTGYGYNVYRNNRGGSLDEVHQFSSSMVLDSRFGLIYHPFGLVYPGASGFDVGGLGISTARLPYLSFPGFTESDGYSWLALGAGGQVSEDTVGSLDEILSKTIDNHSVRIVYTSQNNSTYFNLRYGVHPQVDINVFKKFIIREGVSFEIRGDFLNITNTPNFPLRIRRSARQTPRLARDPARLPIRPVRLRRQMILLSASLPRVNF